MQMRGRYTSCEEQRPTPSSVTGISKASGGCRGLLLGVSAVVSGIVPVFGWAQQSLPAAGVSEPRAAASLPATAEGLIKLDVVVTDKSGKSVAGLESKDFTLLDNGQPQKIVSFRAVDGRTAQSEPTVEVILVVDTLNLQSHEIPLAIGEAEKFLRRNNGHLTQPVSLYLLSSTLPPSMLNPGTSAPRLSSMDQPSTDGNALANAIARGGDLPVIHKIPSFHVDRSFGIKVSGTGHQGINPSLSSLGSIVLTERRRPGRKLLFWISPGWHVWDNAFDELTEFSTRLREARIALWSWPYPDRDLSYQGFLAPVRSAKSVVPEHLGLNVLAVQSGGGLLNTSSELGAMIGKCVEDESVFYTLTFDPPLTNQVDDYHDLKVVVGQGDLAARTSTGYYNEPPYQDHPSTARRVTVAELEKMLENAHGRKDNEVAQELAGVELTERMSSAKLSAWKGQLQGERSKAALVAVADRSVFLSAPAAEIPATAMPNPATRRQILSRTIDYLSKTIVKLPDFFATRTTVQYDEPSQKDDEEWKAVMSDQSLHVTETFNTTVTYRNGKEVVDTEARKGKKMNARERGLDTQGTFGPILAMVFAGASGKHSEFAWSHWEQGADGAMAVFRYAIPQDASRFEVGFCCLADPDGTIPFRKTAAYHGEITIDPASGAILRLTVEANLEPRLAMLSSGIMVEYGSVVIGDKTYLCPIRSVSISRQRTVKLLKEWGESFGVYGRFETILNDVAFGSYHVFRAQSRILPEETSKPE
jgi:VWFA-related protein